jgi:hypothetical protein
MPQLVTIRPLTSSVNTPSVRIFQQFAGESLENLDEYEAWDIITALCQSASLASQVNALMVGILAVAFEV